MPSPAHSASIRRAGWRSTLPLLSALLVLHACADRTPEPAGPAAPAQTADDGVRTALSADGVPIRYRVLGHGEPALILVHGWSCDSTYWDAQLAEFSKRYTVVTLDLAGHGDSGTARADWTMGAFGDDVIAVANQLPNRQLVLIGHGMGGPVVLEAARRLRNRVIGIVGVDTFGNIGIPPASAVDLERRLEPMRRDFATTTRDYVTRTFFTSRSDPELVRRIAEDMASQSPGIAIGALIGMNNMSYAAALGDIQVPIVAISSDRVPTDVNRIRLHAPTFRLKTMSGVGHFVMIEDPARFNALLEQTVQELLIARVPRSPP